MNLYIVRSKSLGKSWALQAKDTEDATGKVLSFDKEWIAQMEAICPDDVLDVDLRVSLIEIGITEL